MMIAFSSSVQGGRPCQMRSTFPEPMAPPHYALLGVIPGLSFRYSRLPVPVELPFPLYGSSIADRKTKVKHFLTNLAKKFPDTTLKRSDGKTRFSFMLLFCGGIWYNSVRTAPGTRRGAKETVTGGFSPWKRRV